MTFACFAAENSVTKGIIRNETAGANSMKSFPGAVRKILLAMMLGWLATRAEPLRAQPGSPGQSTNEIRIAKLEGTAEIASAAVTRRAVTASTS